MFLYLQMKWMPHILRLWTMWMGIWVNNIDLTNMHFKSLYKVEETSPTYLWTQTIHNDRCILYNLFATMVFKHLGSSGGSNCIIDVMHFCHLHDPVCSFKIWWTIKTCFNFPRTRLKFNNCRSETRSEDLLQLYELQATWSMYPRETFLFLV